MKTSIWRMNCYFGVRFCGLIRTSIQNMYGAKMVRNTIPITFRLSNTVAVALRCGYLCFSASETEGLVTIREVAISRL